MLAALFQKLRDLLVALGWLYALVLALAVGAFWGFAELADEVLEREFDAFNRQVMHAVDAATPPAWDPVVVAITHLGSVPVVLLAGAIATAGLMRRGRTIDAATLLIVLAGGGLLTWGLKLLFAQTRPDVFAPVVVETSYSFPSGHTLMGMCLYGFIAVWLVSQGPREPWRWAAGAGFLGLALAIAASRIVLGVHWPTDVAAGMLVAWAWLATCLLGRRWVVLRRRARA